MESNDPTVEDNTYDTKTESKEDTSSDISELSSDSDSDLYSEYNRLSIFVNNIDPDIPEYKLKKIFGSFGNIISFTLKTSKDKRPFALIQYDHPDYGIHFPLFSGYNAN